MNIIEKLGISPSPWKLDTDKSLGLTITDAKDDTFQCNVEYYPWNSGNKNDWLLQATAPEMLEALISNCHQEELVNGNPHYDMVEIIQKATNKSWEEIKTLMG